MKYLKTLNAIHAKLGRLGDLPVFSATVNRIQQISSSKESDAMALAMAVMKDANLSARLLRLSNSTYYNRGGTRINVISRAVIMIGFDEIKNISVTLKLIESFNKSNPDTDISALLMRSFLTAAISRELALLAGIDDIEESYTCGLLHGLGEIIFACTLTEEYNRLLELKRTSGKPWKRIQLDEIGGHFSDIGQELAQSWGFPPAVVQSMDAMTADAPKGNARRNFDITSTTERLLQLTYDQTKSGSTSFADLLEKLTSTTGSSPEKINQALSNGFKMVCDMASEYNLSSKSLTPPLRDSGDNELDEFTRKASYYIHSQNSRNDEAPAPAKSIAPKQDDPEERAQVQLNFLQELSELVTKNTPIPALLKKVIEGIVAGTHCDRAAFIMISKDRRQLTLRLGDGNCIDDLKTYFDLKLGEGDDFFFKVLSKQMTLLVTDAQESGWPDRLPESFLVNVNPNGFIMAPLLAGARTIGFLYADRLLQSGPIDEETFRSFNQFYMQTKMALAYSHQQS
ncbi:MAG: HDOD domain-containing protein [Halopseudomonas sp.]